jgi:thiol-disulfide isomerase/thioredoxin
MSVTVEAAAGVADGADHLAVCLCAAWCDTCMAYRAVFDRAAEQFPAARFVWLDIEDQEELLGPLEVEDFPTLLIAVESDVRFYGTLTPQPETLARLLRASFDAPTGIAIDPEAAILLRRLRRAG